MRIVLALAALSVGVSAQPRVARQQYGARAGAVPVAAFAAPVSAPMIRQAARQVVSAPRQVVSAPRQVAAAPVRLAAGRGGDWNDWNEVYRESVAESDITESFHPQHISPGTWFNNARGGVGNTAGSTVTANYKNYGMAMRAGGHQVRADLWRDMQSRVDDNQSYDYKILDNKIARDEALRFNSVLDLLNQDVGGVYANPAGGFALATFKDYNSHLAFEYDRLNAVNMLRKAEKTGDPNQVARALDNYNAEDARAIATSLKVLGKAPAGGGAGASTQMKKMYPWMFMQGTAYDVKISENDLILAEDNFARNPNDDTERALQMATLNHDGDNMIFQSQLLGAFYSSTAADSLTTNPVGFKNAVTLMNYLGGDMQTQALELAEEAAAQDYYDKYGVWPFHDMDYGN